MEELKEILNLPRNFTYLYVANEEKLKSFRIKEVTNELSAEAWIQKFSEMNYMTWRVLKTYPNAGLRNIYRKDFRCQHLTDRRASGAGPSKNTNCPAKLQVLIKRFLKNSKAKTIDPYIKDYPAIVNLMECHNHPISAAAVLRYRDMSVQTKDKLCSLFRRGHNSSSAIHCLKMDLMLEYDKDYYKIAADGKYLPSISVVTHLFKKEFESEYGSLSDDKMFKNVEVYLNEYNEKSGGKAQFQRTSDNEHYFVVICTPIMLRTHKKIKQANELVLLDAAGGLDKQRHRLYVFVTPTAAGGLPLGIIVVDCEQENVFYEALICFRNLIGDDAFFFSKQPQVFLTDNDMKERKALKYAFPASVLLLCHFHILKSVWSWLCNRNHNISFNHRQKFYFLFKNVLYSSNEKKAEENANDFILQAQILGYINLVHYFKWLMKSKNDWLSCYRKNLLLRGNNTTNYVEIVFRIIKDFIFDRVLAYNLIQLIDFIVTRYELYMKQRLIDFVNGRYNNSLLVKMLPEKCDLTTTSVECLTEIGHFKVKYKSEIYFVDMIKGICSCFIGKAGKICKHSSAVFLLCENSSIAYNVINNETKKNMMYVAEDVYPANEWLQSLHNSTHKSSSYEVFQSESQMAEDNIAKDDACPNVETPSVTDEDQLELQKMVQRIQNGLTKNPEIFVPAFKKMIKNIKNFAQTDSGLVSAMHTFGTYSGVQFAKQRTAKKLIRRSSKTIIGVQPTAIGRRKLLLSGRRKLLVGCPTNQMKVPKELQSHDYTNFGDLPKRKKKAPHNLEQCVFDNKSLGGTK